MSSPVPIFLGVLTDRGILKLDRPIDYGRWLMSLAGQRVEVVVRKRRTQRSDRQNKAYWGLVVAMLAAHLGYDPEELHDALKAKFLSVGNPDDPVRPVRSTTSLTTAEFETYVSQIRRLAAELGCDIPEPNEASA